jgi:flagellin-like hook-associated protein FlgL
MTIGGFAPGAYGMRRNSDLFVGLRAELDDLQRQLSTGKKSETYGGLGLERGTSLNLRSRISALDGYERSIDAADFRLKLMLQGLETLDGAAADMINDARGWTFAPDANGKTQAQTNAQERLELAIEVLNSDVDGRYLFGGRAVDQAPVESMQRILDGDAGHVGLRQYITERKAADLGPGGDGHLALGGAGVTATLSRTDATPYGLQILGAAASGGGVTVTNTGAPPTATQVDFAAPVAPGATVSIDIGYPDGTSETLTLVAKASGPLGPNEFLADADPNVAAASFRTQLGARMSDVTARLGSASAMSAAQAFFAGSTSAPAPGITDPRPVLVWYRGDDTAPSPRETAPVQVEANQSIGTGATANEPALRSLLAGLGVMAAETFADTPADRVRYAATADRVAAALRPGGGQPTIPAMAAELGSAQASLKAADDRNESTRTMLIDARDGIEQASNEEVAASILALSTRLQASYATTQILSQLSLVNYL